MVSARDSRLGGPGSSPGQGTALCSRARHCTLTVPLFTQEYKWVLANLLLNLHIYACEYQLHCNNNYYIKPAV